MMAIDGTPASILVVEDERIVAKDVQQTLRGLGYDCFAIASSGDEALTKVGERRPDLVLMDIRIRGSRDGIDVAHELRERFGLPVIYLTAHADEGTVERARKTEPYGYVLKPVKGPELRIAIEIALYKRRMDGRLRERERWHETTLASISDAVLSVDDAGKVSFVNPAAEQLLALKAKDAIGFPIEGAVRLVDGTDGSALPSHLEGLRALAKTRRTYLLRSGDGLREVRVQIDPVVDGGRALGSVVVVRDATEERKVTRQLELADRMTTVATMIAGLATEVHNPLAILSSNAAFAEEELAAHVRESPALVAAERERIASITKLVGNARTAGLRIAKLVADLRTFARPGAEEEKARTNVSVAVVRALDAVAEGAKARAQLVVRLDDTLEAAIDEARLVQLVTHLVSNATHAIAPGAPDTNTIEVVVQGREGEVAIRVRDTGAGIPDDHRERVFEPFFTTKDVNAGLGLTICAGIAASSKGRIELESALGSGTTMTVAFPAG